MTAANMAHDTLLFTQKFRFEKLQYYGLSWVTYLLPSRVTGTELGVALRELLS
jgi:hypothetical protein